jgi:ferrochelatase
MPTRAERNAGSSSSGATTPPKTTVLLVNMGGPSSLTEIEPYLRAIFADPAILPMPAPVRRALGWWIARRRAPKVAERYRRIGGGSPLPEWTRKQVACVSHALAEQGSTWRVAHAFRYCSPTIAEPSANVTLLMPANGF